MIQLHGPGLAYLAVFSAFSLYGKADLTYLSLFYHPEK
jgi:hypothetical protein